MFDGTDRVELAYVAAVLVRVADTLSVPPGAASSAFDGVVNLTSLQVTTQDALADTDPEWLLNAALGRLSPSVGGRVGGCSPRGVLGHTAGGPRLMATSTSCSTGHGPGLRRS